MQEPLNKPSLMLEFNLSLVKAPFKYYNICIPLPTSSKIVKFFILSMSKVVATMNNETTCKQRNIIKPESTTNVEQWHPQHLMNINCPCFGAFYHSKI